MPRRTESNGERELIDSIHGARVNTENENAMEHQIRKYAKKLYTIPKKYIHNQKREHLPNGVFRNKEML